jgi:hypothetical protein
MKLPRLRVCPDDPHLIEDENGEPFFLLGDTAWEMLHRLGRPEIERYLADRADKGFNTICTVVLSEFDGLRVPNAEGNLPLVDCNPGRPNEAYFQLVDFAVEAAEKHGLYIGLLPTWGDKMTAPWGDGPRIFDLNDAQKCRDYGFWLGRRYRNAGNLLWILGGDRPARLATISRSWHHPWDAGFTEQTDWTPLWRAMADGIRMGVEGNCLIAYHPQGGSESTSTMLHGEEWLDINMMQSGHGGGHDVTVWDWIARDYKLRPAKPTLDAEPNYEEHPVSPWPVYDPGNGYFDAYDVRKQCYRSVFSGGAGVIYGNHCIWQFCDSARESILLARMDWTHALHCPGAVQVGHLRRLIDRFARFGREPDDDIMTTGVGEFGTRKCATRGRGWEYALVYVPTPGTAVGIREDAFEPAQTTAEWFDPRTGETTPATAEPDSKGSARFVTPNANPIDEPDWVLVLTSAEHARR